MSNTSHVATYSDLEEAAAIVWSSTGNGRRRGFHSEQMPCTPPRQAACRGECGRWVTRVSFRAIEAAGQKRDRHQWRRAVSNYARKCADELKAPGGSAIAARRSSITDILDPLEKQVLGAAMRTRFHGGTKHGQAVAAVAQVCDVSPANAHRILIRVSAKLRFAAIASSPGTAA